MKPSNLSRRRFLRHATVFSAAATTPSFLPLSALGADGRPAPSNRVTIACVGFGGEGTKNLNAFLGQPDAQVVAVCDVDPNRREFARGRVNGKYQNNDCAIYNDFREIIARRDIDAMMISTPDHWHVPMSLMALRAGKDVICEKPTLTIQQGRVLSDTVKRQGAVFQTSTEDRGLPVYHRMAELVRNGRIGKLHTIRVGLPSGGGRNIPLEQQQPEAVPAGFDYDLWLGPAPYAPYCAARCHWNFRWNYDYSGGILTDWGMHIVDTAQWGNNTEFSGPVEVEGKGEFPTSGIYNTATDCHLEYTYASGVKLFIDTSAVGLRFEGTDGWIGNKGWIGPVEASSPEILTGAIGPRDLHLYTCPAGEHRNFLDCVKTRRNPYFPAEIGHRCASVLHIGNAALMLGRKLQWNPQTEEFVNDDTANRVRSRAMRPPWTL